MDSFSVNAFGSKQTEKGYYKGFCWSHTIDFGEKLGVFKTPGGCVTEPVPQWAARSSQQLE